MITNLMKKPRKFLPYAHIQEEKKRDYFDLHVPKYAWSPAFLHSIRRALFRFLTWVWFERLLMLVILIDGILVATLLELQDYTAVEFVDHIFLVIYIVEAVLKMFAFGFTSHKRAYFRTLWNVFDLFVIIISLIALIPGIGVRSITTLRLFRLLPSLNAFSGFRVINNVIEETLHHLAPFGLFTLAFIFSLGMIGYYVFKGTLQQRCAFAATPTIPISTDAAYICTKFSGMWSSCEQLYPQFANETMQCLYFADANPHSSALFNFNNILTACFLVLQMMTLDTFENPYRWILAATSDWAFLYMIPVVMIGAYYLLNVILSIVFEVYEHAQLREATSQATTW